MEEVSRPVVLVDAPLRRVRREDGARWPHREVGLGVEVLPSEHRELLLELSLRVEGLDAMVAGVGHENVARGVGGETPGLDALSRAAAGRAPVRDLLPVLVESGAPLVAG